MASLAACRSTAGFGSASCVAAEAADPAEAVGGGADISVGCFGKREGEKTACEIRMEPPLASPPSPGSAAPSDDFFQGLEKYFGKDLKGAKAVLTGDNLFSKSLLTFIESKMEDESNDDEIQKRIDSMDFKGNDIALMFCVFAQENSLHMTKAYNLLLKRFGKEEKKIVSQEEAYAAEAANAAKSAKAEEEIPELVPAEPAVVAEEPKPAVVAEEPKPAVPKTEVVAEVAGPTVAEVAGPTVAAKQVGGKRITRKASSSLPKKKKRVSRGKA